MYSEVLAARTRLTNQYRREAQTRWQLASPFRQGLYIQARLKGRTPEQAIAVSRGNLRKKENKRA